MASTRIVVLLLALVGMAGIFLAAARSPEPVSSGPALGLVDEDVSDVLRQCRNLGQAALADETCREAWRQARERFLAPTRPAR
ncbi:MAG: putative entry exclusion protein TrbK-alt [Bacteroidota bacterium]